MSGIAACTPPGGAAAQSNAAETLIVPSEKNEYFQQDIRFKLTLPSAYLHQQGETWTPPINGVSFSIDLRDDSATDVTPIEEGSIVVVQLSVAYFDAIDASLNPASRRFMGFRGIRGDGDFPQQFGLNYATNTPFPHSAPEETLFRRDPYDLMIVCNPSGNDYPSLCTLRSIGERGGGLNPEANAAVLTEITFRRDRLPDWAAIQRHVEQFLRGKLTVMTWGDS
ncbi:hypothetical protein OF829_12005 [Sphingomonas sp. LB-2]|uniref:hypothetical protein n=1 Tax=Sphingomonas caeni TaxID=2984949 RepID=UPI00222F9EAE|nr:hypothetical protein [Sphingomonas caeni]MCW3847963.1 hypothetical protein [Sphingomonas caeni]